MRLLELRNEICPVIWELFLSANEGQNVSSPFRKEMVNPVMKPRSASRSLHRRFSEEKPKFLNYLPTMATSLVLPASGQGSVGAVPAANVRKSGATEKEIGVVKYRTGHDASS